MNSSGFNQIRNFIRTFSGYFIKIKFKHSTLSDYLIVILFLSFVQLIKCNRPPRFLIDGQTEIVLRLKEGAETPVGKQI